MQNIKFTFPADFQIAEHRGVAIDGGRVIRTAPPGSKIAEDFVSFPHYKIGGKALWVRVAGKPEIQAQIAENEKIEEARFTAALAAEALERQENPRAMRAFLAAQEENTYSENHFPGSRKWFENKDAADALRHFDNAHPELKAALDTERRNEANARYDALSDFVKMGS